MTDSAVMENDRMQRMGDGARKSRVGRGKGYQALTVIERPALLYVLNE